MAAIRYARAGAQIEEIEACYRARFADFARLAGWIVGDQNRGSDVVQEAFATAIRKRRSFRRTGRIDAWICRIVVNRARNAQRSVARDRSELIPNPGTVPGLGSNGSVGSERLRAVLATLPERQRLAVFLRYCADLDYEGIADTMGVTPGTVAATLNAAHKSLQRKIPREAPHA
jgi:RNA polymerase sigma factor (sigma-70 family)